MRPLRHALLAAVATAGIFVALPGPASADSATARPPTLHQCVTLVKKQVLHRGVLTIATDYPALAPWFADDTPSNGQGYESALAYLLASKLGFTTKTVRWVTEHYAKSYQPGPKAFDFDINEIAKNPNWTKNVTFSSGYYNVSQSLVAMKSDPVVKHHTPNQLRTYRYGALAGSPAATYVTTEIKPDHKVASFATLPAAVAALTSGLIDALAIDTPTGNYVATTDILSDTGAVLATQVGQFKANGDEQYALVLQKNNPLAACVNVAIATVTTSGALARLQKKWLTVYATIPTIKP